ncbi:glycosyl transferase [Aeromicrobium sp. A1-2]|uniref:glycosyltransferase family 4 protein n=1 Tax=Aeromicrobium sp. A1-2 TaxID=2107713 RepID=UPI000E49DDD7|nr:glycosyltransferase family 4 protein [Aeromicrobium sp. A1-2]AXT84652.1 glycosyl transferase [Aeromicrobium sp. A1-2]
MRILHVTDCFLPRLGGIEMHVNDLATRQAAAGHDVAVLTRTSGTDSDDQRPFAVERLSCGPLALGTRGRVQDLRTELGIDVVHAHLSVASPLAWTAVRAVGGTTPTLATVHSVVPDVPALVRSGVVLTGFPSSSATFTAVSEAAAAPWRRAMGERMPVHILPNGIDPEEWACRHVGPDNVFTVVSVGRFARRKRQRSLVATLARVRAELPASQRLRAVIVGDGDQMHAVRDDARRLGLADVIELPGALTRDQIKTVLAQADTFAAPATLESFGIAALEARCAGVPVVAMRQGGTGEFVRDDREGLLVRNDDEMADALLRLATDRPLRHRIAEHNRSTLPDMAWPAVLARHEVLYQRAVSRIDRERVPRRLGSMIST